MNKSQFAALIGVSPQQVSKYGDAVVCSAGKVDVDASLANLEGRLDEEKRRKALAVWRGRAVQESARPSDAARPSSGKARFDDARAELAEIELAQKKGDLVPTADLEALAEAAVATLREAMKAGRREFADRLCAEFGISPDRAAALARKLGVRDEESLGRFSVAMASLAAADGAEPASEPAQAATA